MPKSSRYAVGRIKCCCPTQPCRYPLTGPRQHPNRHGLHDATPILPQMKLRHVVRPHQPDKPDLRIKLLHLRKRLRRVARAQLRLDICHLDPRVLHHLTRFRQAQFQRCRPARFQRIARTDHPPHPVQPEPFQCLTRDVRVPFMRRIERPAQKPDHLTGGRIW